MLKNFHGPKSGVLVALLFISLATQSKAQKDAVWVCDVKFKRSQFDNEHAGSGFLLEYGEKVYGITAKHVLYFAKTDRMHTISFGDELASFTLHSAHNPSNNIQLGRLINENRDEKIEMPPKGDWLIFKTTGELPKTAIVHQIREAPLKKGEDVFFMGFPYGSETAIRIKGQFAGFTEGGNLSLDVPPGKYGGCSGGPVTDRNGLLVGIVSMGYFNREIGKQIFEPASLEYFKKALMDK